MLTEINNVQKIKNCFLDFVFNIFITLCICSLNSESFEQFHSQRLGEKKRKRKKSF